MALTEQEKREIGINPCGEIILLHRGFCNLSIAVARAGDSLEDLREKVRLATIIGTVQSLAVNFPGLRPSWVTNAEAERLLGVDITGQADRPLTADEMEDLRSHVFATNSLWSEHLGIPLAASTTCVKPSGNSSVLLGCSPGINPRWSAYQIRNVRVGTHTAMYRVLAAAGAPMDPENGQEPATADRWVVHFPVKAPPGALTTRNVTAMDQCAVWLQNKLHWTEHNPSCTITFKPDDVIPLTQWLWANQDVVGGMAFLPASDHQYEQAPNEEITEEEYERAVTNFPNIDFGLLYAYEQRDETTSAQELACMGGVCLLE